MSKSIYFLALLLCCTSLSVLAQRFEIVPFLGYRFGGDTNLGVPQEGDDSQITGAVSIKNGLSFGLLADYSLNEYWQVEVLLDHQSSQVVDTETNRELVDLGITYFHAGLVLQSTAETFRPFFAFTLGGSRFSPKDGSANTDFSLGAALGFKYYFSERLGFRLQSRLINTFLGRNDRFFCNELEGCYTYDVSTSVVQYDLSGGVIVAF